MKETGIIWDLDGTLLNTLEDLKNAVNYALRSFQCPERTLEEVRHFVGNGAQQLIRLALPGENRDPDPEQVLACFKTYYDSHCRENTAPYPGILPLLSELNQQEYPMAIVSNKPDSAVKILAEDYFAGLFAAAAGEKKGLPRKPAPDLVWMAADQMQIPYHRCIYVGDSEVDIATARNAGMPCISVLWGFRERKILEDAGGSCFCDDPLQFEGLLHNLE